MNATNAYNVTLVVYKPSTSTIFDYYIIEYDHHDGYERRSRCSYYGDDTTYCILDTLKPGTDYTFRGYTVSKNISSHTYHAIPVTTSMYIYNIIFLIFNSVITIIKSDTIPI